MIRRPPRSTLFPSPPLFRSHEVQDHLALPIVARLDVRLADGFGPQGSQDGERAAGRRLCARFSADVLSLDRKSTRLNSSHGYISYAVFCLKKKKKATHTQLM